MAALQASRKQSDLHTLLSEVPAGPVVELHHHQPVAQRLDGSVHPHDPASALCRHVQVVGDGPGRHLQHVVRGALVQEDLAQRRQEGTRGTTGTQTHTTSIRTANILGFKTLARCYRDPKLKFPLAAFPPQFSLNKSRISEISPKFTKQSEGAFCSGCSHTSC